MKSAGTASCGSCAYDRRRPNGSLGLRSSRRLPGDDGRRALGRFAGASAIVGGAPSCGTLGGAKLAPASNCSPSLIESRIGGSLVRGGALLCLAGLTGGGCALSARPSHSMVPWHFLQRNLTNLPRMMWSATENFVLQVGQTTVSGGGVLIEATAPLDSSTREMAGRSGMLYPVSNQGAHLFFDGFLQRAARD